MGARDAPFTPSPSFCDCSAASCPRHCSPSWPISISMPTLLLPCDNRTRALPPPRPRASLGSRPGGPALLLFLACRHRNLGFIFHTAGSGSRARGGFFSLFSALTWFLYLFFSESTPQIQELLYPRRLILALTSCECGNRRLVNVHGSAFLIYCAVTGKTFYYINSGEF